MIIVTLPPTEAIAYVVKPQTWQQDQSGIAGHEAVLGCHSSWLTDTESALDQVLLWIILIRDGQELKIGPTLGSDHAREAQTKAQGAQRVPD